MMESSIRPEEVLNNLIHSCRIVMKVHAMSSARLHVGFKRLRRRKQRSYLLKDTVAVTTAEY